MKKIICALVTLSMSLNFITPLAQGLYVTYFEKHIPLTENLEYISYIGEDSASYSQSVHILDFDPKGDTLPIVGYGKSLLSHKTVASMMKIEKDKNNNVVAGINGDFYSFYTGIPLSTVIRDGVVLSTDSGNNAIGFTGDGKVLVGKPDIKMTFSFELDTVEETLIEETPVEETPIEEIPVEETPVEETPVEETPVEDESTEIIVVEDTDDVPKLFEFGVHYNKYPTVYAVYMTDTNYSTKTASTFSCREIVIKPTDKLKLNSTVEFEVVQVIESTSNTDIPYGSMVLSIPDVLRGSDEFACIEAGDTLTLNITCQNGWENVQTAVGGGDIIVENGVFVSETVNEDHEKYRNARTAVGLREDGTVFFTAVDGDGNSGAGMSFERLAEFMIGEGAVTALNLDGGGSTTVALSFPSNNEIEVVNSPKDGSARKISNSVLFLNESLNYEFPAYAKFNLSDGFILAGSSYELIPEFYNGQGNKITPVSTAVEYLPTDTDAIIENNVYFSADKSYIDRLFVTFSFDDDTSLECETVINVTDKIDNLKLHKNSFMVNSGDTFKLSVSADRYGIPVITTLDTLTYTDLSQTEIEENTEVKTENTAAEESEIIEESEVVEELKTVSEFLFENEYISVSRDGVVTAKDAPLFTRVDLSVSYKDTESVLSVYFGKQDEILDDFDGEAWREKIADSEKKILSKGYRTNYSLHAPDGIIAYNEPVVFDVIPEYFTLWIKGAYQSNLFAVIENNGEQEMLPYYVFKDYSDVSGWVQLIAPIPETLENSISLICPVLSMNSKPFTIDTFTAHYGYSTDPFEDIGGIWSHDYIMQIYDMGIINGYLEDGKLIFKPDNNITRAEFAKMLACYLSLDTKMYSDYGTPFADIDKIAEWSSEYIKALSNEGYMNGKSNPDGTITFDSDSYITREEAMHVFAKLISSAEGDYTLEFADSDSVQPWALESVKRVVEAGVVTGFDDGTLRAAAPVTRAQMCTMFTRLWNINK